VAVANTLVEAGLAWLLGTRQLGRMMTAVPGAVSIVGILFVALVRTPSRLLCRLVDLDA
jgi:hypothetical protein